MAFKFNLNSSWNLVPNVKPSAPWNNSDSGCFFMLSTSHLGKKNTATFDFQGNPVKQGFTCIYGKGNKLIF